MNVVMLQLKELHHFAAIKIMDHIYQALTEGARTAEQSMEGYTIEKFRAIRASVESTTYEQTR